MHIQVANCISRELPHVDIYTYNFFSLLNIGAYVLKIRENNKEYKINISI